MNEYGDVYRDQRDGEIVMLIGTKDIDGDDALIVLVPGDGSMGSSPVGQVTGRKVTDQDWELLE